MIFNQIISLQITSQLCGGRQKYNMNRLKALFNVFCVIIAVALVVYEIYEYNYSEADIIKINFRRFNNDQKTPYPSLTLCFDGITNLKINDTSPQTLPKKDLFRAGSNKTMLKVEEYIKMISTRDFDGNIVRYSKDGTGTIDGIEGRKLSTNIILRRYKVGCFAIGIPFIKNKEINWINVEIKKSIFEPGNVPKKSDFIDSKGKFSVGLTYQNQFFPLLNGKDKAIGENEMKKDCPGFIVSIRGMEIVHKRNKVDDPCNNDGEKDYIKELEELTDNLGCKPEHWDFPSDTSECTSEELKKYRDILVHGLYSAQAKKLIRPCRYMQNIWNDYDFDTKCVYKKGTFHIKIIYNLLQYKEVEYVPAYDLSGLTLNILTILGVILGISLYQTPKIINKGKLCIKKMISSRLYQQQNSYIVSFIADRGQDIASIPLLAMNNEEELESGFDNSHFQNDD